MKYIISGIIVVVIVVSGVFVLRSRTVETSSSKADEPTATASVNPSAQPPTSTLPSGSPSPAMSAGPATFTRAQVATHNSKASCYTVIRGSVYDLTSWISKHPGGQQAIISLCGVDGTTAFDAQHGGQPRQENVLASFKIGVLVQ